MLVKDVAGDFPEITSCKVNIKTGEVVLEHKEGLKVDKFKREIESLGDYKVVN
jgi:hypothetical protein